MEIPFFIKKLVSNGTGGLQGSESIFCVFKGISRTPICLSWMKIFFSQQKSVFIRECISGDNSKASNEKVFHLRDELAQVLCRGVLFFEGSAVHRLAVKHAMPLVCDIQKGDE